MLYPYTYRLEVRNRQKVYIYRIDPDHQQLPGGKLEGCLNLDKSDQLDKPDQLDNLKRVKEYHQKIGDLAKENQTLTDSQINELGELLFQLLFHDGLETPFLEFYQQARKAGSWLRVELDIDYTVPDLVDLAALPWEFMTVPDTIPHPMTGLRFSTADNLVFCRRRRAGRDPHKMGYLNVDEKLRIALATASPDGKPVLYLPVWQALEKLVAKHPDRLELLPLQENVTLQALEQVLKQRPHILHFIGHGQFAQNKAEIVLVKDSLGAPNQPNPIEASEFARQFISYQPEIVILQACEGARQSASDALVSVATQLGQRNIPVVVAMQYAIPNKVALIFAQQFYQHLADDHGLNVDLALQKSRHRLQQRALEDGAINHHFALPVFFRCNPDIPVFQIKLPEKHPEPPPSERLFEALLKLDYKWQASAFQTFVDRQEKIGAFLVPGPPEAGQRWLVKRLVRQLPAQSSADTVIEIDLATATSQGDVDRLWKMLSGRAGLSWQPGLSPQEIVQQVYQLWQTSNLLLVINNANRVFYEAYITTLLAEFWHPLVAMFQKHPPPGNYQLLMFLIDNAAEEDDWDDLEELSEGIDESWQPQQLVYLEPLPAVLTKENVTDWLTDAAVLLPPIQDKAPTPKKIRQLAKEFMQQFTPAEPATPRAVLEAICDLCDENWYTHERSWLAL